jgi:hypothetical protein
MTTAVFRTAMNASTRLRAALQVLLGAGDMRLETMRATLHAFVDGMHAPGARAGQAASAS